MFENANYLLFVQPFDPGDDVVIDDTRFNVRKIMRQGIELVRRDGATVTITTAAIRDRSPVHNITRSGKVEDVLKCTIDRSKTSTDLENIASDVQQCIHDHPSLFSGRYTMWWSGAEGSQLEVSV